MVATEFFLIKLFAAPIAVTSAAFAQKRFSHVIGGLVSGLPFTVGPVSVFLAIEQGLPFAREAGAASLAGLLGTAMYAVTYIGLARSRPWYVCWLCGIAACFLVFFIETFLPESLLLKFGISAVSLAFNTIFIARQPYKPSTETDIFAWWDIPVRAIATLIPLLLITGLARTIGPQYSGLFACFPVIWTIMFIFTHGRWGYNALVGFFRGAAMGSCTTTAFLAVIVLVPLRDVAVLYILATVAAIIAGSFVHINRDRILGFAGR